MTSKGIRILDKNNRVVCVKLSDILGEIQDENAFHWSILHLYASGNLGEGKSIPIFQKQIYNSENGLFIEWNDLKLLSTKFYEIIDMLIIGCSNKNALHRYNRDQEMYETCDIVIEMFDSCYWEVFSKDETLINKLTKKFKKVEFLKTDFQKNQ